MKNSKTPGQIRRNHKNNHILDSFPLNIIGPSLWLTEIKRTNNTKIMKNTVILTKSSKEESQASPENFIMIIKRLFHDIEFSIFIYKCIKYI